MGIGSVDKPLATVQHTRAAAFVLTISILLVLEGTTRANLYIGTPSGQWTASAVAKVLWPLRVGNHDTFPPIVLLVAAIGVLTYGLLGIALGFTGLVFSRGNWKVTAACLAVEFPLGWYFFSSNVLAAYPFMVARAAAPMPGLTGVQSNTVIMMGFLGSVGLGIPILASHFFFVLQLLQIQRGAGAVYTHTYYRARVYFYGALVVIKGVAQLVLGSVVISDIGTARQLPPVVSLPFVVSYGQIDVAVGAAVILLGLFAFAVAGMNLTSMVVPYCLASLFVLTLQLALEDMTQIGLLSAVPGAPTVVGSLVAWNFVTMTMMPAYLIASMVEANVDLGRVLGKSTGDAMPAPNGDIGEV